MNSVVKFRLYPNKSQKRELFRQLSKHCELYNFCRQERIDTYEKTKTSPSGIDQIKVNVPKFKDRANVSSLQQTVRRVDKAFQNFFRRVKQGQKPGFPRYKKQLNSIDFTAKDGVKVKGKERKGKLYVQHIGDIKMVCHRSLPEYSRVTVKYQAGQFYASFTIEAPLRVLERSDKTIGLDFGLKTFVTTSEGKQIDSPKFLRQSLKRLKKACSKRDKLQKGSIERRKKAKTVRVIYRKVTNQRLDFNHKLANGLVKENGLIAIEDLDIRKLSSSNISNVNRAYNDVSWAQFAQMLTYKAESAGRKVIRVNPSNTSKTCHNCGKVHILSLEDRIISCECGHIEDRDVNAAKNILALGLMSSKILRLGLQSQVLVRTS